MFYILLLLIYLYQYTRPRQFLSIDFLYDFTLRKCGNMPNAFPCF